MKNVKLNGMKYAVKFLFKKVYGRKIKKYDLVFITNKSKEKMLLYRQGGRVVNNGWVGSAGGHFEECELNEAKACVLRELEEKLGLRKSDIDNLSLRYVTMRRTKAENDVVSDSEKVIFIKIPEF